MLSRLARTLSFTSALVLAVVFGLVVAPRLAMARTIIVANNGNDNQGCDSADEGHPRRTIVGGLNCLQGAGDSVLIRSGQYNEGFDYNDDGGSSRPSGSSWNDVRPGGSVVWIGGYPGDERPILSSPGGNSGVMSVGSGDYVVWDHLHFHTQNRSQEGSTMNLCCGRQRFQHNIIEDEAIPYFVPGDPGGRILVVVHWQPGRNESHLEFIDNDIHHSSCCYSFYVQKYQHSLLIENNRIHHDGWYGIHLYTQPCVFGASCFFNVVIRNNFIYNNGHNLNSQTLNNANGCGIIILWAESAQIYNNVFYDNFCAVEVKAYSQNTLVANNTMYHNPADATFGAFSLEEGTQNTIIKNNLIYTSGRQLVTGSGGSNSWGTYQDINNVYSSNEPPGNEFVDVGARDFHLQASSSNISNGENLSSYFTTDRDGNPRPSSGSWSRGAYQSGGGSAPLPPPLNLRLLSQTP